MSGSPSLALKAYRSVMRLAAVNSGLTKLSFNPLTRTLFAGATGPWDATMRDGVRIEVDPNDYDGRVLWLFGSNDLKVARTVAAFLRPGDFMLDIGANHATIGFSARHAIGPAGHVHLFEPQPRLADRVQAAIDGASLGERITLHRVALYDSEGTMDLAVPNTHSGMATLTPRGESFADAHTVSVALRRTRDCLADLVGDRPFGVKLDVEGVEMHILPDLFDLPGYRFCVFEGASNQRALYDLFAARGWTLFGLCRTVLRPKLARIARFEDWDLYHDFIALPRNPDVPDGPVPLARVAGAFT